LQWKTVGEISLVTVNIAPRGEATHIQIVGDRGGTSALTFVFPMMGAAILVGALGATFEPTSVTGILSLVTGTLGAGFLSARTLWASSSKKFKKKLTRLVDALSTSVGRGALPRGSEERDD
jgi:hypothetical protein